MRIIHLFTRPESVGLKDAEGCVPFRVSQQHMADALGLALVHTNKTLSRLADYLTVPLRGRPLV